MVIQRIQTVYLLLAAIVTSVFAFVPVINVLNPDGVVEISFNSLHFGAWTMVLEILIVILAIIAIFKYRDLKTQIRLTNVLMLLIVTLIIVIAVMMWVLHDKLIMQFTPYIIMPFVALILVWLAKKCIKHDKKLLADSERIR
jgi:glucan phosphoethanolaminetransferase (alkaline phosphatase superfamily)